MNLIKGFKKQVLCIECFYREKLMGARRKLGQYYLSDAQLGFPARANLTTHANLTNTNKPCIAGVLSVE